ncbi:hypothetical protein [Sphingomonas baiyangensis]|uniref:Uncharacterized protein n=1 Tax=Sphingomonas baiyangensis TaxID=2572576 RepID=A0A4U1L4T0_9SPHN|nr:hypothetical protein [Sphingomonas baiyangensis]TKD51273.1 hypothetical protein FBR43_11295 [Sphingomonas baiyangensis]
MNVLRLVLGIAAVAVATIAAAPAQAQFYFKSKDLRGERVTGAEPGIVGQALPGATPEEQRAALVWNLRAALNVAALQCQFEPTLLTLSNYNAMIKDHEAELAASFTTLGKYFRRTSDSVKAGQTALDQYGTRVYSGFSTVAAQRIFCQTSGRIGQDALFTPRGQLHDLAATRMRELRNSLVPWGEQQFPGGGYAYLLTAAPQLPALGNPDCWRKNIWQDQRCGPVYHRMAAVPADTSVATR